MDIKNRLVAANGKGAGEEMTLLLVAVSRYKLLCISGYNNKVLLYNTENYIQSPGGNHNGKEC